MSGVLQILPLISLCTGVSTEEDHCNQQLFFARDYQDSPFESGSLTGLWLSKNASFVIVVLSKIGQNLHNRMDVISFSQV